MFELKLLHIQGSTTTYEGKPWKNTICTISSDAALPSEAREGGRLGRKLNVLREGIGKVEVDNPCQGLPASSFEKGTQRKSKVATAFRSGFDHRRGPSNLRQNRSRVNVWNVSIVNWALQFFIFLRTPIGRI